MAREEAASSSKPWEIKAPSYYDYCLATAPVPHKYKPLDDDAELAFVQAILRHGDRTPLNTFPHDDMVWNDCSHQLDTITLTDAGSKMPNKHMGMAVQQRIFTAQGNSTFSFDMYRGDCEFGQLTDKGKDMHRDLGRQLRSIYVDQLGYLPNDFELEQMFVRTTNVWRTKNSAEGLMDGLYPKKHWKHGLVMPLYTAPARMENMSPNTDFCPKLSVLTDQAYAEDTWKAFLASQQPAADRFAKILGSSPIYGKSPSDVNSQWIGYMDAFMPRVCHDKPLPCTYNNVTRKHDGACATKDDAHLALRNSFYQYIWPKRDAPQAKSILRLAIGSFIGDIVSELRAAMTHHKLNTFPAGKHRFSVYSGHDDTVVAVLGALNAADKDMIWPPFRSNLLVELWKKKSGKYVVRIIYNGHSLTLKDNDVWCDMDHCSVDTFLKRLDEYVPENLEDECDAYEF
ncbi:histidine phosphatase superfamily [Gongronella butleri]|nr:histidine phosphatase superfamily [Gongronella butleri]